MGVARGVRRLRAWRRDAVIFDEFLLLGVIGLSYGAALAAHTLGFLAVFAAGLALRRADDIHAASSQAADKPPLTPSMLNVNEQLERIVEVAIVLLVGAMISTGYWSVQGLLIAALLFLVIRPLSVWLGVIGDPAARAPRRLLAWFGIRGIGSVYYAVYRLQPRYPLRRRRGADVLRVHRDRRLDHRAWNFRGSAHGAVPATARAGARAAHGVVGQTMTAAPCHSHVIPGACRSRVGGSNFTIFSAVFACTERPWIGIAFRATGHIGGIASGSAGVV